MRDPLASGATADASRLDRARPRQTRPGLLLAALGVTQIFAWGSSYYLPAVLAKPMAAEARWPLPWVVGGLSLGLLMTGAVSPRVGYLIQDRGGRPVLAGSAVLLALGLIVMGLARSLPVYLLAWVVIGLGMGAGLYDAAFAALGRLYGAKARSAITSLTLFGGFSSAICWPLSGALVAAFGWRGTCFVYAGGQLLMSLPLYLLAVPGRPGIAAGPVARPARAACVPRAIEAPGPKRRLVAPSWLAQAAAPLLATVFLERGGPNVTLGVLLGVALLHAALAGAIALAK